MGFESKRAVQAVDQTMSRHDLEHQQTVCLDRIIWNVYIQSTPGIQLTMNRLIERGELFQIHQSAHPSCVDCTGIEWLWRSVVVVEGDSIRVGHAAEDLHLRLGDRLGAHHVRPQHSLVTIGCC